VFLSRNLEQNVPKNKYFLEKAVKIAAASDLRRLWALLPDSHVVIPVNCYI